MLVEVRSLPISSSTQTTNRTLAPIHGPHPVHPRAHRIGGWLPRDPKIIRGHVNEFVRLAKIRKRELVQPIKELQDLIYGNPIIYMLFTQMLNEVPKNKDPSHQPEVRDIPTLLLVINDQIQSPIKYNDGPQIGTPVNAIIDWPMGTKAGFAVFLRDDVNQIFQKILRYWGEFLKSDRSVSTVSTHHDGWLSATAQNDLHSPGLKNFTKKYVCNPDDPHYGFKSWDDFFVRKFRPGIRPLAAPTDDSVIVSAAESTPFAIQTKVKLYDTFWAKGQNYSLAHLLGDVNLARRFVGGTVYQAFLGADCYHNWHAPVTGKYVVKPKIIGTTFYSEPLLTGFDPDIGDGPADPDPSANNDAQGYISAVAVRGVAVIQAKNPNIGLMAVVMIGMAEVSSVDFDDLESFEKGQEIGRFHYGGSTHCLIFGPDVKLTFQKNALPRHGDQPPVPVLSALATVARS